MSEHKTQRARILALLMSKEWVTLPEIMDLRIACHTKRISELREEGFEIVMEPKRVGKSLHTRYRLVPKEKQKDFDWALQEAAQ
jgi:helix-turn-helix protein